MRAIVIGSGIAGLAAALALHRVGVDVAVYERAPALAEVGAGIGLWANAWRALDHIGAGPAVRAAVLPMDRSEFRVRDGRRVVAAFRAAVLEDGLGVAPFVAIIHRAELVAALSALLPPETVRYGFACVGVEAGGDRAVARFANGHADDADAVVGADGIRSAVRAAVLGPGEPRYAGYTCWRGVCPRPPSVAPGYVAEWWGRGRRVGITTLPGDRVYWWAAKNEPAGRRAADERAFVAAAFGGWAEPVPELIATTPEASVLRNDILDRPPTRGWAAGRAVLVGDAAHPTTPNFGQGGCLAIEDAVVLARCLRGDGPVERRLAAFEAERFPRTAALTREARWFGRVGQWEGTVACWARDRLMGALLPVVGTRGMMRHARFDVGPLPGTISTAHLPTTAAVVPRA